MIFQELSPSQFQGEAQTCVVGRLVHRRAPFDVREKSRLRDASQQSSQSAKTGSKGGKGKKSKTGRKDNGTEPLMKFEFHLLGGDGLDEVLYAEAWGDVAEQAARVMKDGKVYRIANAKMETKAPLYSTSRLRYFLRIEGPIGIKTIIEEVKEGPFLNVPMHHPITSIDKLNKIGSTMRVCLAGLIFYQPGAVTRDTQHGQAGVCNAVIKQGNHQLRCSFWRNYADDLSAQPVDTAVVLMHVTVKKVKADSWEAHATESTQIIPCPEDVETALRASTEMTRPGISLTATTSINYDTVPVTPYTLSALGACIVPQQCRDLTGVYEVHNVAIMGIAPIQADGTFLMNACTDCKKSLGKDNDSCDEHPDAGTQPRWLMSLELADDQGSVQAIAYHDALAPIDFLPSSEPDTKAAQKMQRQFRSQPWSVRIVFKQNTYKNENSLEIKRMAPTFAPDGIIYTYSHKPAPQVVAPGACPFTACTDVAYDADLGVVHVKRTGGNSIEATAVRILVRIQEPLEDEVPTVPDPSQIGLQVTRKARCALNDSDETIYDLVTAGVASSMQWLISAPHDRIFLITATVKAQSDRSSFRVLSFWDTSHLKPESFIKHVKEATDTSHNISVEFSPSKATPCKRQTSLSENIVQAFPEMNDDFSKRRRV